MAKGTGNDDVVNAIFNKHRKQLAGQPPPKKVNGAGGIASGSTGAKPYERQARASIHAPSVPSSAPFASDSWQHDLFQTALPKPTPVPSLVSRVQGAKDLLPSGRVGAGDGASGMRSYAGSSAAVPVELLTGGGQGGSVKVPRELLGRPGPPTGPAGGFGPDRRPRLTLHQAPLAASARLYPGQVQVHSRHIQAQPKRSTSGPVELIPSASSYNGPRAPPLPPTEPVVSASTSTRSGGGGGDSMDVDMTGPSNTHDETGKHGLNAGESKVIVEGLVLGTTDEDVWSAFSSHFPLVTAKVLNSPAPPCPNTPSTPLPASRTSAELVLTSSQDASLLVERFNGILADDFNLRVYIWTPPPPKLKERMGLGRALAAAGQGRPTGNRLQQALGSAAAAAATSATPAPSSHAADLLPGTGIGRMYSDEILQRDPRAKVLSLGDMEAEAASQAPSPARRQPPSQPTRPGVSPAANRSQGISRQAFNGSSGREPVKKSLMSRIGA